MRSATIVVDLGYGDAGKGSIVDYLSRRPSPLVVRFNGGPQAAHNVVRPDGRHHTFASFGAGTFNGARTHLSSDVLVNPIHVLNEADGLERVRVPRAMALITFDPRAKVITPWHKALNRIRERSRGKNRHGSCGHGVGETMQQDRDMPELTLRMGSWRRRVAEDLVEYLRDEAKAVMSQVEPDDANERDLALFGDRNVMEMFTAALVDCAGGRLVNDIGALHRHEEVIFEGAQGVLLDENFGWHPFTTWSTTTPKNALRLIDEYRDLYGNTVVETLGLTRTYMTRHGPGPFPTETALFPTPVERHNAYNDWQRSWRVGHLDRVALRYALTVCGGVDSLVVSHVDQFLPKRWATEYRIGSGPDQAMTSVLPLPRDRASQVTVSALVAMAKPVYEPIEENFTETTPVSFFRCLGLELDTPVRLTSHGPTYNDKNMRWNTRSSDLATKDVRW